MKKNLFMMLFLLTAALLSGCLTNQSAKIIKTSDLAKKELTIAAASDLSRAFTELGADFESAHNCIVTFSFGSTGTLSEQITNGAPFDLFAAANEKVIEDLDKNNLILSDTKYPYALGRIGIAAQKDSTVSVVTLADLLKPEIKKIAIANPAHAPYGLAAQEALTAAGLWDELEPKLVYGKNISEALSFITTGNADAGLIALSLHDESKLNFSLIDTAMHQPLRQTMAVIKTTKEEALARAFITYVNSLEGKEIMSKYGFAAPEE